MHSYVVNFCIYISRPDLSYVFPDSNIPLHFDVSSWISHSLFKNNTFISQFILYRNCFSSSLLDQRTSYCQLKSVNRKPTPFCSFAKCLFVPPKHSSNVPYSVSISSPQLNQPKNFSCSLFFFFFFCDLEFILYTITTLIFNAHTHTHTHTWYIIFINIKWIQFLFTVNLDALWLHKHWPNVSMLHRKWRY